MKLEKKDLQFHSSRIIREKFNSSWVKIITKVMRRQDVEGLITFLKARQY